jgi:hypothetical protein
MKRSRCCCKYFPVVNDACPVHGGAEKLIRSVAGRYNPVPPKRTFEVKILVVSVQEELGTP